MGTFDLKYEKIILGSCSSAVVPKLVPLMAEKNR